MVRAGVGYRAASGVRNASDSNRVDFIPASPVVWKGIIIRSFGAAAGVTVSYRVSVFRGAVEAVVKKGWYRDWGEGHPVLFSLPTTNDGDILAVLTTDEAGDTALPSEIVALYDPDPPTSMTPIIETALPGDDFPPWVPAFVFTTGAATGSTPESFDRTVPADEEWRVIFAAAQDATTAATWTWITLNPTNGVALGAASASGTGEFRYRQTVTEAPAYHPLPAGDVWRERASATVADDTINRAIAYEYRWWGVP